MRTVVLYNCPDGSAEDAAAWRGYLAAYDPAIEFRIWPETGRVEEIDHILAWMSKPGEKKNLISPNKLSVCGNVTVTDGSQCDKLPHTSGKHQGQQGGRQRGK